MSSAYASFGSDSEGLSARFGHHAGRLLIASIIAVVAVGLHPLPDMFLFTVPLVLFAFVIVAFLAMRAHDRRLCEQCAAHIPLNPAARAKKLERRFWMAHTGSEPRFLVPYLVVLLSSNLAVDTTFGKGAWAVIQLSMIYLIMSQQTHRTLQPWCPWCSDGGGGEEVDNTPPSLPQDDRELI